MHQWHCTVNYDEHDWLFDRAPSANPSEAARAIWRRHRRYYRSAAAARRSIFPPS